MVGIAEGLGWPDRLNPFMQDPGFPYGHLPLYLLMLIGGQDRLSSARLLAGLADTGTVALTAALGCRMAGRRAGLLTAAFLAVMPLHVQQAHFATADPFLALFTTGALLWTARMTAEGRLRDGIGVGLWAGLALGCKAGAALLLLPLIAAGTVGPGTGWKRVGYGLTAATTMIGTFALTNPFAILEFQRFALNVTSQAALARGAALVPYTLQYHATLPYIYPITQQLVWGMGPLLGALCFGGLALALWQAVRHPPTPAQWIGLAWSLPFFAFVGGLYVKFPRYLLPLTPLLAVYGAQSALTGGRLRLLPSALALLPAGAVSAALILSYQEPHPWIAASNWLRDNVPPGSVIAVEAWDHPLPVDSTGYAVRVLPVFDEESQEKWAAMEETLAEADVLVIASRRGYGALAGWPERFPRTAAYYRALLAGERGFAVAACFGRWPRVGPLTLTDDPFRAVGLPRPDCPPPLPTPSLPRLDESLVVYDHPLVVILRHKTLSHPRGGGIIPPCETTVATVGGPVHQRHRAGPGPGGN